MEIKQSEFVTSAVNPEQYPVEGFAEFAFVGRSNVGKSSLINALTNRNKLAKVSNTPGRTRLVNYFLINNTYYFVDLPGYGFAKVSKVEKLNWGVVVDTYLNKSRGLKKVILLVDSRHKPTADDITMYNWIKHYGYSAVIVGTKCDKLSNNDFFKSEKLIRDTLKLRKEDKINYFSSVSKKGKTELLDTIFEGY
jgi:GTP-binding protein